jgi:hypothetical protein
MFPLHQRRDLMERTADSLTNPDFVALTSLRTSSSEPFLGLEAKIREDREPFQVFIQRKDENNINYQMSIDDRTYTGRLEVTEDESGIVASQFLDKMDDYCIVTFNNRKGKQMVGFRKDGKIELLPKGHLKYIRYWVNTVVNRLSKNADYFVMPNTESEEIEKQEPTKNSYRLKYQRDSPKAHYRKSHTKSLETDEGSIEVDVSGTYVNVDWENYTTEEVVDSIREHAHDINPLHFSNCILPRILMAGHDKFDVLDSYGEGRTIEAAAKE